ncbi:MAG: hypothetical protein AAB351_03545 [Patescibacteria group bacterium]
MALNAPTQPDQEQDPPEETKPSDPKFDAVGGPSELAKFSNFRNFQAEINTTRKTTVTGKERRMSDLTVVRKRRQAADSVNAPKGKQDEAPEQEQKPEPETPPETQAPQAPEGQAPEVNPEQPQDDGRVEMEPEEAKEKPDESEVDKEQKEQDQEDEDEEEEQEEAIAEAEAEQAAQPKPLPTTQVAQAQQAAKDELEKVAGKKFVSFVWSTVEESLGIGLLWAIPTFDVYIIIGWFNKRPFFHQLPKWQIVGILIINLLVIFTIIMVILLTLKAMCSGFWMSAFRKALSFVNDTADTLNEVCKQVEPLIKDLPDLGA